MRTKQKIITLFDDMELHAIKQVVSVADEEDLNQLWEYILHVNAVESGSEVYVYFVGLYELVSRFLESNPEAFFELIIEQSDESYHLTVWNKKFIRFALKEWKKRRLEIAYNRKRITLRLSKQWLHEKSLERKNAEEQRITHFLETAEGNSSTVSHPSYDFIETEDLAELITLSDDLNECLYNAHRTGLKTDVLIKARSYFSMMAVVLGHYAQIEQMSLILTEMSILLTHHKESFTALRGEQIALIDGFAHNFNRWLKIVFIDGGANLHFMDRSMRADLEMIRVMVEPYEETAIEDLDDIFDF